MEYFPKPLNMLRLQRELDNFMKVQVKYYGVAREASGKREETVELNEGSSVMNLIKYIVEKYGEPLL
jgi:hypothetical protein